MNTLSLYLYLIDILSNIKGVFIVLTLGTLVWYLLRAIAISITYERDYRDSKEEEEFKTKKIKECWAYSFKMMWIPVLCVIVFSLIPNERTRYAILASELGEQVITSEISQEYFDKIKSIFDNKLKEWE